MAKYDYILLDADNTLWDFDLAEHLALQQALQYYGISCTPEVETCYVEINSALWAAFDRGEIQQQDLAVQRFAQLLETIGREGSPSAMNHTYLTKLGEQGVALEGADGFCRQLAEHCTLAIVTNGLSLAQHGRFDRCTMKDCISKLYISQEIGHSKPQKAFFDHVLTDLGITDLGRVLVIGDSLSSDILGAKQAGLDAIWFNPKEKPCPDHLSPVLIAKGFEEMAEYIL